MSITEDIAFAISKNAWQNMSDKILSSDIEDDIKALAIEFLNKADSHLVDTNGNHLIEFADVPRDRADSVALLEGVLPTLLSKEWLVIFLDENDDEDSQGNWYANPFGVSITKKIQSTAPDHCEVWISCGIDLLSTTVNRSAPTIPPPAPTVAVNNHTCVFCGNTSCSKSEKSCWKCGGAI
jgi:hypothetical protein